MSGGDKEENLDQYNKNLNRELDNANSKNNEYAQAFAGMEGQGANDNIVEFQLETEKTLEKIEHFLRADVIITNADGTVDYGTNPDKSQIILNDHGINYIMSTLQGYFHKGTFLSNLEEQRIYGIMSEIANEIRKYTYCNYEKMGMDTPSKVSRFPSLLVQVFHMTELSLMRAWKGEERTIINTSNIMMQNQSFNNPGVNAPYQKEKYSFFKPKTW